MGLGESIYSLGRKSLDNDTNFVILPLYQNRFEMKESRMDFDLIVDFQL